MILAKGMHSRIHKHQKLALFNQLLGDGMVEPILTLSWATAKYRLKRRPHPLTGPATWNEFEGTGTCLKVWDGRAQLDTLEADDPTGHIEGLVLRLYNPQTRQWSLYWTNSNNGTPDPPQIGQFKDGPGEFYAQEMNAIASG